MEVLALFIAVNGIGLRTAEVATAMQVTPRAIARVLPGGARIARERRLPLIER